MIQTGVRVTELTALRLRDVNLATTAAHIRVSGKGRKLRAVTLTRETAAVLREWLNERQGRPEDPLFPTGQGRALSRDAIAWLTAKHAATASIGCPSLTAKNVTPHVLRHTNAMLLKANGVDIATIALWLGHQSITTNRCRPCGLAVLARRTSCWLTRATAGTGLEHRSGYTRRRSGPTTSRRTGAPATRADRTDT